jgi:integrase
VIDRDSDTEIRVPKRAKGLTAKEVVTLPPRPTLYSDGDGLLLRVVDPELAYWVSRITIDGKTHDKYGIGRARGRNAVGLAEARKLNLKRRAVWKVHPELLTVAHAPAPAVASAMSFEAAARGKYQALKPTWRSMKHDHVWWASVEQYLLPTLGKLPADQITVEQVLAALRDLWRGHPETASRTRQRGEAIIDYAMALAGRDWPNPFRWKGRLQNLLPSPGKMAKREHFAAPPWAELPRLMSSLSLYNSVAARAAEFCILTAARPSEVIAATWSQIDGGIWTRPTKPGALVRTPLSAGALAVLDRVRPLHDKLTFIGPQGGHLHHGAPLMAVQKVAPGISIHAAARSCFADWSASNGWPTELVELALGHTEGKVRRAYHRHDELEARVPLMTSWCDFLTGDLRRVSDPTVAA